MGHRLRGRGEEYKEDWWTLDHFEVIHLHKPEGYLNHWEAVFMCELDDIDVCGGATETAILLQPIGKVTRHDLNWGSYISSLYCEGHGMDSEEVIRAAKNYWEGVPFDGGESVWEYLAAEAVVLASANFEDADILYDWMPDSEEEDDLDPG